jgi:hypothetical protein
MIDKYPFCYEQQRYAAFFVVKLFELLFSLRGAGVFFEGGYAPLKKSREGICPPCPHGSAAHGNMCMLTYVLAYTDFLVTCVCYSIHRCII